MPTLLPITMYLHLRIVNQYFGMDSKTEEGDGPQAEECTYGTTMGLLYFG